MASCRLKGEGYASQASWVSDGAGRNPHYLSSTVSWEASEFSELETKIDFHLILPQLVCIQLTLDTPDAWDAVFQLLTHVTS